MKSRKIAALALTGVMVAISLSGCGASDKKASEASQASSTTDSNKKVFCLMNRPQLWTRRWSEKY